MSKLIIYWTSPRTCLTDLISTPNVANKGIDYWEDVNMSFLDFSKTFDEENHGIMRVKPYTLGVLKLLIGMVCSFKANEPS